ncbi:RidA family protein [Myxococcota bacterium]|nr:RidA family protein [Myxococcota bacterium]
MSKTVLHTESAPKAIGPYSQGIATEGLVFCSGQIGLDPATGVMVEGGLEPECRRALDNLKAVLASAGLTLDHVVRTTIWLTDMADFAKVNEIYASYFSKEPPARTTIAVSALPKGGKVEIDAIATRG